MPRTARVKMEYGIYYISQKSGSNRQLFVTDNDRDCFINILKKTQENFHFKIYAYCIMKSNEYHLVIDVNGNDLSKIMKSINISYAIYTKCTGKLFKDRFKSKILNSPDEVLEIINKIHNRYKDNSPWNSYCVYSGINHLDITHYNSDIERNCSPCIRTLDEAKAKLIEITTNYNITLQELLTNLKLRNQLIKKIRKNSTLSLKEIGTVFDLSESMISKIIKE